MRGTERLTFGVLTAARDGSVSVPGMMASGGCAWAAALPFQFSFQRTQSTFPKRHARLRTAPHLGNGENQANIRVLFCPRLHRILLSLDEYCPRRIPALLKGCGSPWEKVGFCSN
jgi:hypothetical protein